MESLALLKYLHAAIEEGLRMYPPAPFGLPRWTPAAGAEICGQNVPPKVGLVPNSSSPMISQMADRRNRHASMSLV